MWRGRWVGRRVEGDAYRTCWREAVVERCDSARRPAAPPGYVISLCTLHVASLCLICPPYAIARRGQISRPKTDIVSPLTGRGGGHLLARPLSSPSSKKQAPRPLSRYRVSGRTSGRNIRSRSSLRLQSSLSDESALVSALRVTRCTHHVTVSAHLSVTGVAFHTHTRGAMSRHPTLLMDGGIRGHK